MSRPTPHARARLTRQGGGWVGHFTAFGSPCELHVDHPEERRARRLLRLASEEAWRIEAKYSRYRDDSLLTRIHRAGPRGVRLDAESVALIDLAERLYHLSAGRFDISAGVLRRAWRFDGSACVPSHAEVEALRPLVGWDKVSWHAPRLALGEGMEIDLGGLGKEYAVDRALALLCAEAPGTPLLVNFGGDLCVSGPRADASAWRVGLDDPAQSGAAGLATLALSHGALATSGDARRYLLRDGVRYGHILDATSGWPVQGAPRAVSVHAATCLEAGMLATLAMLRGAEAGEFLREQGARHWLVP